MGSLPPQPADTSVWRHPRANRECALGGVSIAYEFRRSQRRTLGLHVGPLGLSVRAPMRAPWSAVEAFLHSKSAWVLAKLQRMQAQAEVLPALLAWVPGGTVAYQGQTLSLGVRPSGRAVQWDPVSAALLLPPGVPEERSHTLVQQWLRQQARQVFTERLAHFAPVVGVAYRQWCLTNARTRWGSASARGVIRLHWRLIQLPSELLDYVVVHELCHLLEMNHSPRFWAEVQRVLPDHEVRRQALRRVHPGKL